MTWSPPRQNLDFAAARPRAPDSATSAVSARRANHHPRDGETSVTPGPAAVAREQGESFGIGTSKSGRAPTPRLLGWAQRVRL